MGYAAGGTDYAGMASQRQRAREAVTASLKAKGERDRQARIKKSGERSGLAKLGSAVVRGAAAYYTGGMSEQMGAGSMIDEAMLGTDSEGRAVRNEYGEIAGMASQVGSAMSAKQGAEAAKKLEMQGAKDQAMQARLDKLDPKLGMDYALNLEKKDKANLAALQKHKSSFSGLMGRDVEGLDLEPTTVGNYEAVLNKTKAPDAKQISFDTSKQSERSGGFVPPPADEGGGSTVRSGGKQANVEADALAAEIARRKALKGVGDKGDSKAELDQRRILNQWTSNLDAGEDIRDTWSPYSEKNYGGKSGMRLDKTF